MTRRASTVRWHHVQKRRHLRRRIVGFFAKAALLALVIAAFAVIASPMLALLHG